MPAVIQSTANGVMNADGITLTMTGVQSQNLLVAMVSILQASTTAQAAITPTDTNGSWHDANSSDLLLDSTNAVRFGIMGAVQANCASGNHSVTYNFPNGVTYAHMTLAEISGAPTSSPLDSVAGNFASQTGGGSPANSPLTVGPFQQTQRNNLLLAGICVFAGTGTSNGGISDPPANYTSLSVDQDLSTTVGAEHAYRVISTLAPQSVAWAWTDGGVNDVAGFVMIVKDTDPGTGRSFMAASHRPRPFGPGIAR